MPDKPQSLADHLAEMQDAVYLAESLVRAVVACGAYPNRKDVIITAAEAALDILREVGSGLDSVNLPEVSA
jgi:hypothetical protein